MDKNSGDYSDRLSADDRGMDVVWVPAGELNPAEYNPRKMSKKERRDLRKSIEEFGMVEPIIVNAAEERFNVIIGGHQRWIILQEDMGWEDVPVVYVAIPDIKRERQLNVRLNKNTGSWDTELLRQFDESELRVAGFDQKELDKIFHPDPDDDDDDDPEVEFSEELQEEHNYVVLFFDTAMDWLRLQTIFPLPTVKSLKSRPGWEQKGVGRVVRGTEFLDVVLGDEWRSVDPAEVEE